MNRDLYVLSIIFITIISSLTFLAQAETFLESSLIWEKIYSGLDVDGWIMELVQTSDGGYALAGGTGIGGLGLPIENMYSDAWLVKVDSFGNMEWQQTYGGQDDDVFLSLVQTNDGGYALVGETKSFGKGYRDAWLVKVDSFGNMEWQQTYGGQDEDYAFSLVETGDGGCVLAGVTGMSHAGPLNGEAWLVKVDSFGNMEWQQIYDGPFQHNEWGGGLILASDGGYVMTEVTEFFGTLSEGNSDVWIIKTDSYGNKQWEQVYDGSSNNDGALSVIETIEGGYVITGWTWSSDSALKAWVIKVDSYGIMQWQLKYQGPIEGGYVASSIVENSKGCYAITGFIMHASDVDRWDAFLIKLESTESPPPETKMEKWAVVIGVEEYSRPGVSNLLGPANSASQIYQLLTNEFGFMTDHINRNKGVIVDRISNSEDDFSRTELINELEWLNASSGPEDTVFFYYAGHGGGAPASNAVESIEMHFDGLSDYELADMINKMKFETLIVILDCSYSGGFLRDDNEGDGVVYDDEWSDLARDSGGSLANNRIVLTACGEVRSQDLEDDAKTWYDVEMAFTHFFIEGLNNDENKDGLISVEEAFRYAEKQFPRRELLFFYLAQEPQMYDSYKMSQDNSEEYILGPIPEEPNPTTSLIFMVHSPVELHVYDSAGKHVGFDSSGELELGFIADCYTIDDVQIVAIPEPKDNYEVELVGTGSGQYNLTAIKVTDNLIKSDSIIGEVETDEVLRFELKTQKNQPLLEIVELSDKEELPLNSNIPMELFLAIVAIVAIVVVSVIAFKIGKRRGSEKAYISTD